MCLVRSASFFSIRLQNNNPAKASNNLAATASEHARSEEVKHPADEDLSPCPPTKTGSLGHCPREHRNEPAQHSAAGSTDPIGGEQ